MAARVALSLASIATQVRLIVKEATAANWTAAQVNLAIQDEYAELWSLLGRTDSRRRADLVTMTYTASSERVTLPAAALNRPLMTVEDFTNTASPIPLDYVTWDDLFLAGSGASGSATVTSGAVVGNRKYSLLDDQIALWPTPGADVTLRLGVSAAVDDLVTANHELEVEFEPLLYWGAALRLLEQEGEESASMQRRYDRLRADFVSSARRWVRSRPKHLRRLRRHF